MSGLTGVARGNSVVMSHSTIRALFDDGPRTGQVIGIDPGPDGGPPEQVVVSDPLSMGGRREESFEVAPTPVAATTYHLHGHAGRTNTYIYRTGEPD